MLRKFHIIKSTTRYKYDLHIIIFVFELFLASYGRFRVLFIILDQLASHKTKVERVAKGQ